ncbi:hypothetical protein B0H14DRAFT_1695139 [Mycena olivaceomarginata]|nr:hypothetical protein B0H14DRAFT_1695139 [Mycena olivaceomarginata]
MRTDFDGIERRNPIFADIFSILTPGADATTHSAIACCWLSPASSSFSQYLLALFPGTRRLSCKQGSLSCLRYTSLRTAVYGIGFNEVRPTVCVSPSSRPAFSLRALILIFFHLLTLLQPCPLPLQAPHAMRIRTMSVSAHGHRRSLRPPPYTSASSRAYLSRMREPIAAKQRRRSAGNWAVWAPAAMRSTGVALVIYGLRRSRPPPWRLSDGSTSRTPSASRYFSARMSSGLLSSPTDWDLERASVLVAPANPGMGTRSIRLHVLLLPANLHFHTVFVAAQTRGMHESAHVPPRAEPKARRLPLPRPSSGSLALDLPSLTVYSPVTSIRLSAMLSPSTCRLPRTYAQPLSPQSTTLLPQHLQRAPAHSPLEPANYNTFPKRSTRGQNTHVAYDELVVSATPTTSRPHPPPRSRPRPALGWHHLATPALATRRRLRKHRIARMGIESPLRSRGEVRGSCRCGSNRERTGYSPS